MTEGGTPVAVPGGGVGERRGRVPHRLLGGPDPEDPTLRGPRPPGSETPEKERFFPRRREVAGVTGVPVTNPPTPVAPLTPSSRRPVGTSPSTSSAAGGDCLRRPQPPFWDTHGAGVGVVPEGDSSPAFISCGPSGDRGSVGPPPSSSLGPTTSSTSRSPTTNSYARVRGTGRRPRRRSGTGRGREDHRSRVHGPAVPTSCYSPSRFSR